MKEKVENVLKQGGWTLTVVVSGASFLQAVSFDLMWCWPLKYQLCEWQNRERDKLKSEQ